MNQACGGLSVTCAVPVFPAILTPGTAAFFAVPEMTTCSIISESTEAVAGLIDRLHMDGSVSNSIEPSEVNTSSTR